MDARFHRRLGRTDLVVSSVGLGCDWFSRGRFGRILGAIPPQVPEETVRAALEGGINWFDTAEAYGWGESERLLARSLRRAGREPGDVLIADKWYPVLRRASHLERTFEDRLACLGGYGIDLYQVHERTLAPSIVRTMEAMSRLVAGGRVRAVGVSNFSAEEMRVAHACLARTGIPLASNQVRYSLLDRRIERNGVLATARELDVTIIAYEPLAQGILTGRYHDDPSLAWRKTGPRGWSWNFRRWTLGLGRTRPLMAALRMIADAHGVEPAQIAIAWLLGGHDRRVVAIPGATAPSQALANARAMAIHLSESESRALDSESRAVCHQ